MECPTKEDLLLHLVNDFDDSPADDPIPEHLEACLNCRSQARALERVLDTMQYESGRDCDAAVAKLLDDLKNPTPAAEGNEADEHLQECRACNTLRLSLTQELSFAEVMALDFTVPDSLKQRIEKILPRPLGQSPIKDVIDALVHQVDDLVDRITLILQPNPAPVFLGSAVPGTVQIETTSTRDLYIEVGEANRTVKIFSENNIELGQQISSAAGTVVFKDFVPATYKLCVEGFDIQGVDLWP